MDPSESLSLRSLLENRPVAALASLHKGAPAISMVPFALLPETASFVIHVSRLATHTQDMLIDPAVALLVVESLELSGSPLSLPRVSVQGHARPCKPESPEYERARASYLAKLPEAEELFTFSDFSLFLIDAEAVRYVAGFGRAMSVTSKQLEALISGAPLQKGRAC